MNIDEFPMQIFPLGESAIRMELGNSIHPDIHRRVKRIVDCLDKHPFPGMVECVPAFTSVTVLYDPLKIRKLHIDSQEFADQSCYEIVSAMLQQLASKLDEHAGDQHRIVEIPVCYGGQFGPDLEVVAAHNGLTPNEVIDIHSSGEYLVYMIGFAPGFPYLGEMPDRIATPRRSSPRTAIPAGTVGIAGMQTGIYPISTPGGWQLIGRTPLQLFRPDEQPPSLLRSGDTIIFRSISLEEFESYGGANP
ncbi:MULTISPECIES: 5-oxoprolinase subunit PxpB [unclassified Paenibacillus]|uniref:5-oxoprolinase subunit PxpB n=2 Tax=unclassified Paenibacillus TaxID=185978 RepID=UPI002407416B|nr:MULTISPECIES: 5-oxoprolinase subunit PxpB [unclassified Paenibacillus]